MRAWGWGDSIIPNSVLWATLFVLESLHAYCEASWRCNINPVPNYKPVVWFIATRVSFEIQDDQRLWKFICDRKKDVQWQKQLQPSDSFKYILLADNENHPSLLKNIIYIQRKSPSLCHIYIYMNAHRCINVHTRMHTHTHTHTHTHRVTKSDMSHYLPKLQMW